MQGAGQGTSAFARGLVRIGRLRAVFNLGQKLGLGFEPFDPEDPDQFDLYLLTSDIEATLRLIR